jgi:hypothetical protein
MLKVMRIYDTKEKSITDQLSFNYVFMYGKSDKNGKVTKPFIEKFYTAYYGKEEGLKKLEKFYDVTKSYLGDSKTYFNLVLKEDCIDLKKFKKFFSKVYPSLAFEIKELEDVPRIEYIKLSFAGIMYEDLVLGNTCDMDISLERFLTANEVEELMDVRELFENGYKYRMDQFECEVCKEHDINFPIHLEFDPFAKGGIKPK